MLWLTGILCVPKVAISLAEVQLIFHGNNGSGSISRAKYKMDAALRIYDQVRIPYYCFHDVDVVEEAPTMLEFENRLHTMVEHAKGLQAATGKKLLWDSQCVQQPVLYERCGNQPIFPCKWRLPVLRLRMPI